MGTTGAGQEQDEDDNFQSFTGARTLSVCSGGPLLLWPVMSILPYLARVGDVGPPVGLRVEALYLHDPNMAHPLGHQVDLGTDEIGFASAFSRSSS